MHSTKTSVDQYHPWHVQIFLMVIVCTVVLTPQQSVARAVLKHKNGMIPKYNDIEKVRQHTGGDLPSKGQQNPNNVREFDKSKDDPEETLKVPDDVVQQRHDEDNLKLGDLGLADHMDGVKLEKDGHLNKEYKKEVLFGDIEDDEPNAQYDKLLITTFKKADANNDTFLTTEELTSWIQGRVEEHLRDALEEGKRIFNKLDQDNDGFLKWSEYLATYKKMKDNQVHEGHMDGRDSSNKLDLDSNDILQYKRHWDDADKDPADGKLSSTEFLAFKHPEQSLATIDGMVRDILEQLDTNRDNVITLKEFVNLPDGGVDIAWVETRQKEFQTTLDENNDGNVTLDELKRYVDPRHPKHALEEAENLVAMADEDKNGKLSLDEVLHNREVFMGSKMINVVNSFHDEF